MRTFGTHLNRTLFLLPRRVESILLTSSSEGTNIIYVHLTSCSSFRFSCPILSGREFVVSIMSDWFVEAANHTCGSFPPEVDEMKAAGLTPVKSTLVQPPRVEESGVNMECKVIGLCDDLYKPLSTLLLRASMARNFALVDSERENKLERKVSKAAVCPGKSVFHNFFRHMPLSPELFAQFVLTYTFVDYSRLVAWFRKVVGCS